MLPLSTFAILQGVLCVAGGAETTFDLFPFIRGEGIAANPIADGEGPYNPDGNPSSDGGFYGAAAYAEAKSEVISQSESSEAPSELSLAKWSGLVCTKRHPLIEHFIVDLVKRIKSSKKIAKGFDLRKFTAHVASAIAFDVVFQAYKKVCSPDARLSAQIFAQAVIDRFDKVEEDSLIYITANSAANILFFRGLLKPNNVAGLSQRFFQDLKRKVDDVKHPKPETILRALGAGYIYYLTSLGQFTAHTIPMLTLAFSSEFYDLCSKSCP